jgi:hypothetical protein
MPEGTGDGLRLRTRAQRRVVSQAISVYAILGAIGLGFFLISNQLLGRNEVAAMAIGGLVGAVEILGRYRHAPFRAVLTWNGILYIVINLGAAWAAYYMLGAFQVFEKTAVAKDLTQILTAGFGSLVFMRSSIFKVRVGESDIGIGPAAILDTLLLVADRGVDRREAVARAQDVTELVSHVRDPAKVAKMLTRYSLALMQNVDERTSQELAEGITKIMADPEIPDAIKIDIVALRLGIVVGPDVLEAAVAALGDRLISPANAPPPGPPPPPPPSPPPPPPSSTTSATPTATDVLPMTPTAADLKAEIEGAKSDNKSDNK